MAYAPLHLHARPATARAASRRTPSGTGLLVAVWRTIRLWRSRIRDRADLARMSERDWRDLRLSRSDVRHEVDKPFWRE